MRNSYLGANKGRGLEARARARWLILFEGSNPRVISGICFEKIPKDVLHYTVYVAAKMCTVVVDAAMYIDALAS